MSIDDEAQALLKRWQSQQAGLMGHGNQLGDPNLGPDQSPFRIRTAWNRT